MATDVDVQYFSHLNGLTLGNNWGDLIRLLDKALVTGIDLTQITAASIDTQGDVRITLYAAHNAMLFQVVELTGFTPTSLNQKYRIKGVPSTTELILKPHTVITETTISTVGLGKLASLGYDIVFRDTNDVKRVYRAKNPHAEHPFIRVDESIASGTGAYDSTYAKYAMVGLLEHMSHIDDYQNPDVLQLPFYPTDYAKNWKITGTGTSVVRGWSRWYWARGGDLTSSVMDTQTPTTNNRAFTLVGDSDAFYLQNGTGNNGSYKRLYGAGLFNACLDGSVIPSWFLMSQFRTQAANTYFGYSDYSGCPLVFSDNASIFQVSRYTPLQILSASVDALPIMPDYRTGASGVFGASALAALEIPFKDNQNILRGTLKHVAYNGRSEGEPNATAPILQESSMYIRDGVVGGSVIYYLGEIE